MPRSGEKECRVGGDGDELKPKGKSWRAGASRALMAMAKVATLLIRIAESLPEMHMGWLPPVDHHDDGLDSSPCALDARHSRLTR
eukprot:6916059-Prymnesium_polylepis.1